MKCRWAIIGTGEVAAKFAIGLRSAPGAELALVASRSKERAVRFAAGMRAAVAAGGYDAATAAEIDAVYIATPPSEHRNIALRCLEAGKAVLLEKPFAENLASAMAIVESARAHKRFCMEGMWTRFLPALARARTVIAEGRIGKPEYLNASFAVAEQFDPGNSFFMLELGGGILGHRGIYPLSLAIDLLGPAKLIDATVRLAPSGVEDDVTALLQHSSGAVSSLYTSARTTAENGLVIYGTEGALRFIGPIYRPLGIELTRTRARRRGTRNWNRTAILKEEPIAQKLRQSLHRPMEFFAKREQYWTPYIGNGYAHEAIAVMTSLSARQTEHPLMSLDASLASMAIIEQIKLLEPR